MTGLSTSTQKLNTYSYVGREAIRIELHEDETKAQQTARKDVFDRFIYSSRKYPLNLGTP